MPTYEYACKECGEHLEAVQAFSDDPLTVCPKCGGELRKVFSAVGIVFKGSGFYKTDNRSNGSRSTSTTGSSESSSSSDSGSKDSSSSKDSSTSTTSSESKKDTSSSSTPASTPASSTKTPSGS